MGTTKRVKGLEGLVGYGLLDAIPDGMIVCRDDGTIDAVNARVETLSGYRSDELIGEPVELLIPLHLRAAHQSHREGYARAGFPARPMGMDLETRLLHKDGHVIPVDIALSSLEVWSATFLVAAVRNATERLAVEAVAEDRERRLTQLYANSPLFIFGMDTAGVITDCNPVMGRLLHLEAGDVIGRRVSEVLPDHGENVIDALQRGDGHVEHEGVVGPPGSRRRTVGWHTLALKGADGEVVGGLSVGEDLTNRLRRQRSIASMTAVTGAILEGLDPWTVQKMICREATQIAEASVALVATKSGDGYRIEATGGRGTASGNDPEIPEALQDIFERLSAELGSVVHLEDETIGADLGPAVLLALPGEYGSGFLLVADERGAPPFDPDTVEALDVFAFQASLALAYGRRLRKIAVADDRDRIARDLHDLIIQRLFAAGLSLQASAQSVGDRPELAERLIEVVDTLDEAIAELRRSIFHLEHRESGDLRGRVIDLVEEIVSDLELTPTVDVGGVPLEVPEEHVGHLLATLREALTNTARHSNATHVEVDVRVGSDLLLVVRDNGSGLASRQDAGGHGLGNMERRAREFGGELRLTESGVGGLELTWRVPLGGG